MLLRILNSYKLDAEGLIFESEQLTKLLKQGKLETGWYYIVVHGKCTIDYYEEFVIDREKNRKDYAWSLYDYTDIEKVLAKVPDYLEFALLKHKSKNIKCCAKNGGIAIGKTGSNNIIKI